MAASVKLKASKTFFFLSLSLAFNFPSFSRESSDCNFECVFVCCLNNLSVRRTIEKKASLAILRPQNDKKQSSLSSVHAQKARRIREKKDEIRSFFSSTHKISKLPDKSCPNCNFSSTMIIRKKETE